MSFYKRFIERYQEISGEEVEYINGVISFQRADNDYRYFKIDLSEIENVVDYGGGYYELYTSSNYYYIEMVLQTLDSLCDEFSFSDKLDATISGTYHLVKRIVKRVDDVREDLTTIINLDYLAEIIIDSGCITKHKINNIIYGLSDDRFGNEIDRLGEYLEKIATALNDIIETEKEEG